MSETGSFIEFLDDGSVSGEVSSESGALELVVEPVVDTFILSKYWG